jgi:hypothetical protein
MEGENLAYTRASKMAKYSEGELLKKIVFADGEISLSLVKSDDMFYCCLSLREKICQVKESTNIDDILKHFNFFFKSLSKNNSRSFKIVV